MRLAAGESVRDPADTPRCIFTTVSFGAPVMSLLSFIAWNAGWLHSTTWPLFSTAVDIEWFVMQIGPLAGTVAGVLASVFAVVSRKGLALAILALLGNIGLAATLWSALLNFPAIS
jgi:hypothetical protein